MYGIISYTTTIIYGRVRTIAFDFPIECLFFGELDPIADPNISFQDACLYLNRSVFAIFIGSYTMTQIALSGALQRSRA